MLHLDSSTGISVRLAPAEGGPAIDPSPLGSLVSGSSGDNVKQAEVTGPQNDGSYVLRLDGISAHRLADYLEVTGTAGSDGFSVGVCALSYARTVYWTSAYDDSTKDAMDAFLEYYEAAVAYWKATA